MDNVEVDQSCKFKADPIVLSTILEIEAKKRQRNRRIAQREREKQKLEEAEKNLQEMQQQLKEAQQKEEQKEA